MSEGSANKYPLIDYLKFFAAFLIVGIHTEPFGNWFWLDKAFGLLTRVAVPFFFTATAFFFFQGEATWKRCFKYCLRILRLYVFWSVVYYTVYFIKYGEFSENIFLNFFVHGGYLHLWFLHACIVAMLIMTALVRLLKNNHYPVIYSLAAITFALGVLISTYSCVTVQTPFFESILHSRFIRLIGTKNGLFYGFPFFALGFFFAKHDLKVNTSGSIAGIIISFIILAAESMFAVTKLGVNQTVLWFSMVPLTLFVFAAGLSVTIKSQNHSVFFRKCSTGIYCVHPLFIIILENCLNGILLMLAVSVLSFAAAAVYYSFLQNTKLITR